MDALKTAMDLLDFESEPSMMILIDCWKTMDASVCKNIYDFCKHSPGLETVVLATYISDKGEKVLIEEPWYSNAKNIFFEKTRWEPLRDVWKSAKFLSVNEVRNPTSPIIADISNLPIEQCLLMWHYAQLCYYLNFINPHIRQIILAGFHWDQCIKWRTLGWLDICRLVEANMISKNIKIVSHQNLVGTMPDNPSGLVSPHLPWIALGQGWIQIDMPYFLSHYNGDMANP